MLQLDSASTAVHIPEQFLLPNWSGIISESALDLFLADNTYASKNKLTQVKYSATSSAILNGGQVDINRYINLHVSAKYAAPKQKPITPFNNYATKINRPLNSSPQGNVAVGMMTAASMRSCCIAAADIHHEKIFVAVTTGLGNLRAAGDVAEYRELYSDPDEIGTINIVLGTSAILSEAAKIEALLMVTEAKVAALNMLALKSTLSKQAATGTGTDSTALITQDFKITNSAARSIETNAQDGSKKGSDDKRVVNFVGKHTLFGEILARLVIAAITDSVAKKDHINNTL